MEILIAALFALSAGLFLFVIVRWAVTGRPPIQVIPPGERRSASPFSSKTRSPSLHEYCCKRCGTSVSTTDRLDGYCSGCFDDVFSSASERMDRER